MTLRSFMHSYVGLPEENIKLALEEPDTNVEIEF